MRKKQLLNGLLNIFSTEIIDFQQKTRIHIFEKFSNLARQTFFNNLDMYIFYV